MKIDTTVSLLNFYRTRIRDLFNQVISYKCTLQEYLTLRGKLLREVRYAKLPRWAKSELWGYSTALWENLYQDFEFKHLVEGEWLGKDDMAGKYQKIEASAHFWKGTDKRWS